MVKSFRSIPGPFRLPMVGNLLYYKLGIFKVEKYHEVVEYLYKTYGPIVRQDINSEKIIHVFEPEDVKTVYNNEGKMPKIVPLQQTVQLYRKTKNMSVGLGNMNGEEWYRLRSAVRQMMLRKREVHHYLPYVQEVAEDFVKNINKKKNELGEIENLADEVSKWSQESAGVVCFEKRLGCLNGGETEARALEFITANREIFVLSGELKFSLPIYKYVPTPKWNKLLKAQDKVHRLAMEHICDTIMKVSKMKEEELADGKYNFMAYLLSREELSKKDVTIITFSLFADGLSTTVPTLLYNLYCLATNPSVQEKAYHEISCLLKKGDPITYGVVNKLSYLKAVVKETFRLYPIGTEISRITEKDLVLSHYYVPSGTHVNLCPGVHFRSEKYFSKPNEFIPERWTRSLDAKPIHPYLLTPFSHGVRTCAGMRFAEQDLYVVLAIILLNFKLEYTGKKPLQQVFNTLLIPEGPVRVQFLPRN